jgi:hypothetical protein
MKTFIKTLALATLVAANSLNAEANNDKQPAKAKHFATNAYKTTSYMTVNLAVEKVAGTDAHLKLTDSAHQVIFQANMDKAEAAHRWKLDLSELKDGAYRLEITDGSNTETKVVQVISEIVDEQLTRRIEIK